jgi:hypothetical protein
MIEFEVMTKTLLCLFASTLAVLAAAGAPEEKEVLAAMNVYKEAMIHNDAAVLDRILANDIAYVHSAGELQSKAGVIEAATKGKSIIERIDFSGTTVRIYGNTALVRGRVDLWHSKTNIVHMNVLHVWIKGPEGWRMVSRQATRLAE